MRKLPTPKAKSLFLKVSFVLLSLNLDMNIANAQTSLYFPFPTDSAQWSVSHNLPTYTQTIQHKMKGDSVLNGVNYHKIYSSTDLLYGSSNQTLNCFLREDASKKIYIKFPSGSSVDTSEFLLYDFSLSVGDTALIHLINYSTDSLYKMVVLYSDSSLLGGSYRKMIMLRAIPGPVIWGPGCDDMWWIQGMGASQFGLLYNELPECSCFCDNSDYQLSCFWDNGTYLWGGTNCDYATSIENSIVNNFSVRLYPNPLSNSTTLEISNIVKAKLEIYNLLGEIVMVKDIIDEKIILLNKFDFSSGIFIYKITSESGIFFSDKFTVE